MLCQLTPRNQTTANDLSKFIASISKQKTKSKMPIFQVERTGTKCKKSGIRSFAPNLLCLHYIKPQIIKKWP